MSDNKEHDGVELTGIDKIRRRLARVADLADHGLDIGALGWKTQDGEAAAIVLLRKTFLTFGASYVRGLFVQWDQLRDEVETIGRRFGLPIVVFRFGDEWGGIGRLRDSQLDLRDGPLPDLDGLRELAGTEEPLVVVALRKPRRRTA
jgi:hypothetical protein